MAGNAGGQRGVEDRVELRLDGEEVILAESYQVKASILTQPAAFSIRLGTKAHGPDLMKRYPPRTPFQLLVNGNTYQTGLTDGYSSPSASNSQLVIEGRDLLQELHHDEVDNEEALERGTFKELVEKQLKAAGLSPAELTQLFPTAKAGQLVYSNEANRKQITGARVRQIDPPRNVSEEKIETVAGGLTKKQILAQLGEPRISYIRRYLDLGGLFLWAAGDGSFVLSEPNPGQVPLYRLIRRRTDRAVSTIKDHRFSNMTVNRAAVCTVHARAGGGKHGRQKVFAKFEDEEMKSLGYSRAISIRDVSVDSPTRGEFLARRKIAETLRAGWKLSYLVEGHTTGSTSGGKAVWAPDTVVEVDDDWLGMKGSFYIESVTFQASPQKETWLELMRIEDLVFAERGQS